MPPVSRARMAIALALSGAPVAIACVSSQYPSGYFACSQADPVCPPGQGCAPDGYCRADADVTGSLDAAPPNDATTGSVDAASPSDALTRGDVADGGGEASSVAAIPCGGGLCAIGQGLTCCATNGQTLAAVYSPDGSTCVPTGQCPSSSTPVQCHGQEDCPAGDVCCANINTYTSSISSIGCFAAGDCNPGGPQDILCTDAGLCPSSYACTPWDASIYAGYSTCH